jgi:hypothetical protein
MEELTKTVNETRDEVKELKKLLKELRKDFKGLVEIQQKLVHVQLGVAVPSSPVEYGEDSKSKSNKCKIEITGTTGSTIKISGNTFDIRDIIKESGKSKWEQETKSWILPYDCLDIFTSKLEKKGLVKDTDFSVTIIEKETETNKGFGFIE